MKKTLLSLVAMAMCAGTALADTATFDFTTNAYGLPEYNVENSNNTKYAPNPSTITNEGVSIELSGEQSDAWRMWSDGLRAFYKKSPKMTVSAGANYVTSISITCVNALTFTYGDNPGVQIGAGKTETIQFIDECQSAEISVTGSKNNAISKIVVEYSAPAAGDLKPAGLSLNAAAFTTRQGTTFNEAVLTNPNNLPVTWTSSEEAIATVAADGVVTTKQTGTVTITASTAETSEFKAGEVSYTLTVAPTAFNIANLLEKCPAKDDKAYVNFSMYVTYVNGSNIYVKDILDNATLIYGNYGYKMGDIIPAGWYATYAPFNGLPEFKMSENPEAAETSSIVYPTVKTVTLDDVNKVVIIKGVSFAAATPVSSAPSAERNFTGVLLDNSELTFRANFKDVPSVEAGKYNVTCVVARYNNDLQVFPIAYEVYSDTPEPSADMPQVTFDPTSADGTITWVPGDKVTDPHFAVNLTTPNDEVVLTIGIPEGWKTALVIDLGAFEPDPLRYAPATRAGEEWTPVSAIIDNLPGSYTGNTITMRSSANEEEANSVSAFYLVNQNDEIDMAGEYYRVYAHILKTGSLAVDEIEAADAAAEYYTLQGVRVVNPENGIFVKVANGKAKKVMIK